MAQRTKAGNSLAGTLAVSECEVWADFDAALGMGDVLLNPGPEWQSASAISAHYGIPRGSMAKKLEALVAAGQAEKRQGRDRETGRMMPLYRMVGPE